MVKALVEFALGAAVIVSPQCQLPVLAGSAGLKLGSMLVRRARGQRSSRRSAATGAHETSIELQWDRLSVSIMHKKTGQRQQVFKDLEGSARPGRSVKRSAVYPSFIVGLGCLS